MSDLQTIFAMDPEKCTKEDITEIVRAFRERRTQFNLGNNNAGSTKAPTARESEALKAVGGGLNIKDLL
jgi:hypothetical protein